MARRKISYVYFIQALSEERLIKIGWTVGHPDWRLQQLRLGSPVRLMPLGVIRTFFRQTEGEIHQRFGELRRHGEWFEPGERLLAFIKRKARHWPVVGATGIVAEPTPERMRKAHERTMNELIEWAMSVERIRRRAKERERRKKCLDLIGITEGDERSAPELDEAASAAYMAGRLPGR